MTESIFTRVRNKKEHDIVYKPRDGDEMQNATLNRVPVYKYSELCEIARKHGVRAMFSQINKRSKSAIILLQDPSNMNSGHWISLSFHPERKQIYFFSTYGGKPDIEKIRWMEPKALKESGQDINIFNDGLRECQQKGWEIHYNDFPYQKEGDHTATCGIFTAAFLRSGKNPDQFHDETMEIAKKGKNPAVFYFEKYFR